jgi:hypothetical protein
MKLWSRTPKGGFDFKKKADFSFKKTGAAPWAEFSPGGDMIAMWTARELTLIDAVSWQQLWSHSPGKENQSIFHCVFSPDGQRLIYCEATFGHGPRWDSLVVLNARTGTQIAEIGNSQWNKRWSGEGEIQGAFSYQIASDSRIALTIGLPRKGLTCLLILSESEHFNEVDARVICKGYGSPQSVSSVSRDGERLLWSSTIYNLAVKSVSEFRADVKADSFGADTFSAGPQLIGFAPLGDDEVYGWLLATRRGGGGRLRTTYEELVIGDVSNPPAIPLTSLFRFPKGRSAASFCPRQEIIASVGENSRRLELWTMHESSAPVVTADNGADVEWVKLSSSGDILLACNAATVGAWTLKRKGA